MTHHPDQLQALEKVRDALKIGLMAPNSPANHRAIHAALSLLPDLIASAKDGGWQDISTCKPFDGLVAYIAFEDGFYGLAKYKDFEHKRGDVTERVQFWSLSDYHDYETYKWYGNSIEPTHWFAIPKIIPTPPKPEQAE